jgi:hypothetical protein
MRIVPAQQRLTRERSVFFVVLRHGVRVAHGHKRNQDGWVLGGGEVGGAVEDVGGEVNPFAVKSCILKTI